MRGGGSIRPSLDFVMDVESSRDGAEPAVGGSEGDTIVGDRGPVAPGMTSLPVRRSSWMSKCRSRGERVVLDMLSDLAAGGLRGGKGER